MKFFNFWILTFFRIKLGFSLFSQIIKIHFNTLPNLSKSSKKGFENRSVDSTPQESTPKSVCFSFLLPPEVLPELSIRETTRFISRIRTEFFSYTIFRGNIEPIIRCFVSVSLCMYRFSMFESRLYTSKLITFICWIYYI